MNTLKYLPLSILVVMSLMISCTSDGGAKKKAAIAEQLKGHWDLTSATRNGEKTSSLEGTYMDFAESNMTCNFTGEELKSAYTLSEDKLSQGTQDYTIKEISESKMVISTKLSIYDFELTFTKSKD